MGERKATRKPERKKRKTNGRKETSSDIALWRLIYPLFGTNYVFQSRLLFKINCGESRCRGSFLEVTRSESPFIWLHKYEE
jgi:hypothetical protein